MTLDGDAMPSTFFTAAGSSPTSPFNPSTTVFQASLMPFQRPSTMAVPQATASLARPVSQVQNAPRLFATH